MIMKRGWEHFDHQADMGIRGFGRAQAEAFEQVALALTAVITPPEKIEPHVRVTIQCEAPDRELLLADWLNAVLLEMSALRMVFSRFEVVIEGTRLTATLGGETVDQRRHQPAVEVKGASYHDLQVVQYDDGHWMAQCVVDV